MLCKFHFQILPYVCPYDLINDNVLQNRKVRTCDFDFLQVWFESQEEFMVMGQTHRKTNPHYQLFR